jgi:predicted neuraminidase
MATAISEDGGKTWRAGGNPADDNSTAGHGFIDIAADAKGNFHLVWLDSRSGKQGLRYARSTDAGKTWEKNQTLDDETCECCWNSVTTGADGCVCVLYRDKDPRDMALMISRDHGATWQRAGVVGKFNWQFDGCPHVGGNVCVSRDKCFHAVVWTGAEGRAGIYHCVSRDGVSWDSLEKFPVHAHRPDIAVSDDGKIAVVWDGISEGKYSIWGSVSADGEKWSEPRRLSAPNTNATHPRVVATSQGFRVFWTETADNAKATWRSVEIIAEYFDH